MIKFEVGKTYACRSAGDNDCIIRKTIIKRTEKTLTVAADARSPNDQTVFKVGVYNYNFLDIEFIKPWGSYSMAPILTAEKEA